MPSSVRKKDIDRERKLLEKYADKEPALKWLLDKLPPDYDPEADGSISDEPEETPDDRDPTSEN